VSQILDLEAFQTVSKCILIDLGRIKNERARPKDERATISILAVHVGSKSLKKRLHKRQTTHYKSAYEDGTPLHFTRRPNSICVRKLAAE
jgi:hypothetical protein